MDRLTKRNSKGIAYMAITDTTPTPDWEIEGTKPILEGLYSIFQKLADFEDREETISLIKADCKLTNADKIRTMTDEELAEWLDKLQNQNREDWDSIGCYNCTSYGSHHCPEDCRECEWKDGLLTWLKRVPK